MNKIIRHFLSFVLLFVLAFGIVTCTNDPTLTMINSSSAEANPKLTIWWAQGFLPEENVVISQIVSQWQAESGYEAELVLLPDGDILKDTQRAIEEKRSPDILFSFNGDTNLFPILAWNDRLADVSDLLIPLKSNYTATALQAVNYQNSLTNKRSYYAIPIGQQTLHLHYWKDKLEQAGISSENLPKDWEQFWRFWEEAQTQLDRGEQKDVFGLGLCMSALGTDTFWAFEHFLEAYNLKIVDENGKLLINNPRTRQGIINTLNQFAGFYQAGYVPPQAVEWSDSGNNINFLEGKVLMTANSTLSIPFTQKQKQNDYNKLSTDLYFNQIATTEWPNKPNGANFRSILSIKQMVMFKESQNQAAAKSFLAYFLKPENLNRFLQDAQKGRIFPVMPQLLNGSFWNDPKDPHMSVALKQFQQPTRPSYQVFSPAYSEVLAQNIWAKAILKIIQKEASPEQAGNEAIAQIQQIFDNWQ